MELISLVLGAVIIIQNTTILYLMLGKKNKNKVNIEEYETVLVSIASNIIRSIGTDDINIDELCDEIKNEFIIELKNEDIEIDTSNINEYIKDLIVINNLLFKRDIEPEINKLDIDEIVNQDSNKTISILEGINDFYL